MGYVPGAWYTCSWNQMSVPSLKKPKTGSWLYEPQSHGKQNSSESNMYSQGFRGQGIWDFSLGQIASAEGNFALVILTKTKPEGVSYLLVGTPSKVQKCIFPSSFWCPFPLLQPWKRGKVAEKWLRKKKERLDRGCFPSLLLLQLQREGTGQRCFMKDRFRV